MNPIADIVNEKIKAAINNHSGERLDDELGGILEGQIRLALQKFVDANINEDLLQKIELAIDETITDFFTRLD